MKKIVDSSVLNIVTFPSGFVFAKKEETPDGTTRAAFYCYNAMTKKIEAVRRSAYLQCKFGENFEKVVDIIGNFIFCDCVRMPNTGEIVVLTPDSKMFYISKEGELIWNEELCYRDSYVQSLAVDDNCVWCAVPEKSSVVRFSPSVKKVYLRVGGAETPTFSDPIGVSKYANNLYVSCGESKKIRKIDFQTYSVKDYKVFDEPVYKYYRIYEKEFALLKSGLYML
ncbi:MAG: hypothetical protein IIX39_00560 [Clostridia bacterium]|nr:hypothetical protein [Clostridia bacterium]